MKIIILIRHATTAWNRQKRIQGQTNNSLDKEGIVEAEQMAKKLLPLKVTSIISSDLKRASMTAQIIGQLLKLPIILDKRLRECSFGNLESMTKEEAAKKYGKEVLVSWEDGFNNYDFQRYGGENKKAVLKRHLELIDEINEKDITLLVGHGRGLNTLLFAKGYEPTLNRGEYRVIK